MNIKERITQEGIKIGMQRAAALIEPRYPIAARFLWAIAFGYDQPCLECGCWPPKHEPNCDGLNPSDVAVG